MNQEASGKDYGVERLNNTHESLQILDCTVVSNEEEVVVGRKRKKIEKRVYTHKIIHCKCYLCGQRYEFSPQDFDIRNDAYGSRATWGYYCMARCDCHAISSFQWRTVSIFHEYNIPYRVEEAFPDLLSDDGNPLRYDFAILNSDNSIRCLIECQGKQHFQIGGGFGGYSALRRRQERDEMKREYARNHNIPLYEIHYKYDTYEKEEQYLQELGIIEEVKCVD